MSRPLASDATYRADPRMRYILAPILEGWEGRGGGDRHYGCAPHRHVHAS